MEAPTILMPGDIVSKALLPDNAKSSKSLGLGPGLRQSSTVQITATAGGSLSTDRKKNAAWLETNGTGRYVPVVGDVVIATVHHHAAEMFSCSITPHTSFATLPQLAFEGASKKTRPNLQSGSLVYARVSSASRHMEPELECIYPATGKANGLGELSGGTVFDISLGMARRLLMKKQREEGQVAILEKLGESGLRFEIAVGRNGLIWVNGEDVRTTLTVGKAIQDTDELQLSVEAQTKLARKATKPS